MQDQAHFACVVGAPRCGTTSLARFLEAHPNVAFSSVKEPHFFAQHDLAGIRGHELRRFVRSEYLARYFPTRSEARPMLAEGSVSYIYAPQRMEAVLRLWHDARFIIALRDPMEMLPSLHQRLLFNGDENVTDFERAWGLMRERREGRCVPRTCVDSRTLQYEELGRLGTHVERFFRAVGRERCFVVLLDDLSADPERVYREMLDFLGLPLCGLPDFAPRRQSQGFRIGSLQRFLKRPPVAARSVLAGEKYRMRVRNIERKDSGSAVLKAVFAARKKLMSWNSAPAPPVRLSDALRRDIRGRLSDEVAKLSEVIGRDFGHWLDGAQTDSPRPAAAPALARERTELEFAG